MRLNRKEADLTKPFLSIIIPARNAEKTLPRLLEAIFSSEISGLEVLVVDDCSSDGTRRVAERYPVKFLRLKEHSGPAKARNLGAQQARGDVLLLMDSDVVPLKGTLERVLSAFKKDLQLKAVTGVWSKEQESSAFFPNFKALRDWSYWIHERDGDGYYFLFSPRIAAIRKKIFNEFGGFNSNYKGADVEDIELTYKIAEKYPIRFDDKMIVKHEFGGFSSIAKGYFRRSYLWTALFLKRLKFDPVATTGHEALAGMLAVFSFVSLILSLLFHGFLWLALVFFLAHLYFVRRFLRLVFSEKGPWFAAKSAMAGCLLYLIIYAGAAWYLITLPFRLLRGILPE